MKAIRRDRKLFYTFLISLLICGAGFLIILHFQRQNNLVDKQPSNYEMYSKEQLHKLNTHSLNYLNLSNSYKPIASWTGRLILSDESVLFEVHNAEPAYQKLVGKVVKLQWNRDRLAEIYPQAVAQDIRFTQETENSQKSGNVHPQRLNNRKRVNPLESLAGARPIDDVVVALKSPVIVTNQGNHPTLIISQEPVQITGALYALVTIVKSEASNTDRFIVHHFNKVSKQFDGALETIRIPQVIADRSGIYRSTNKGIENSRLNPFGWYIYGTKDADGVFVVQAIEPRALMRLEPDELYSNPKSAIAYVNEKLWKNTESQKGTAKAILLDPTAQSLNDALTKWQEGDRAIVIHTFGGIGGKKAESAPLGVVTGHFSYGIASVVRDPFTDALRFDIEYRQVYAHNPDGIIAGSIKWASYMGDLQRGWLGNRPVSDAIVKLDAVTQDYDFDGIKLSPLAEFSRQLDIMMARYRTGDGTGAAIVTPVTSCVQDSNQALFITIKQVEKQVQSNPRIQEWLKSHPQAPQTLRFQQLVQLGRSLEKQLAPLGLVRSDWRTNSQTLVGTRPPQSTFNTILQGLTSWRTILPRRAHDEILTLLLNQGASVWVLRTNQVGGFDPNITPVAPTAVFGHRSS